MTKTFFLIAACICCFNIASAQNFTTKGVEFWAAYGAHASMFKSDGSINTNGGSQKMVFYFLSNRTTTVTVEIPAIGWKKEYSVKAGKTTETDEMPKAGTDDVRLLEEGVSSRGIHITSDEQISAYCHIFDEKSSATSLLLPVNISGQEYYTLGYKQETLNPHARSYCFVIATEDNTDIEVTPAANTLNHPAGVPFFQKLNKGEVLTLFGTSIGHKDSIYQAADLSGTYVRTLIQQNNDVCKKILVFSGSTATSIICKESTGNTADALFQQVPCIDNWGKSFIAVPTLHMESNRYRAMVLNPKQKVFVNGRLLTNIINNRYYEFKANQACTIRSDSLMAVAQYITSSGQCGNEAAGDKVGDPEMIFLTPNGRGLTSTIIHSARHDGIEAHFINVVLKANDVDSFKLDNQLMPQVFKVYERNSTYAYAQIEVTPGRHVLECDSGFYTYAYGYGKLESYGYNGGYSTKYTGAYLGVQNPYTSIIPTTTCTATPFKFYFDIEVQLLSLYCNFNNNPHLIPNNELWLTNNLQPDSIYYVDSTQTTYYRYFLPDVYQYSTAEQMPIQLTAYFPDKRGCIVKKQFSFLIDIIQKPVARIYTQYDSCINNALFLNDHSLSFGNSQLIKWQWNFSDGKMSNERNPMHQFDSYGEYITQLRTINDVGCYADTIQNLGLYHRPASSFEIVGTTCNKEDIFFKSTATVESDELSEWKWVFPDRTTAFTETLIKQFADSGIYEVKLIAKSKHGCTDTATQLLSVYQTPEINLPPIIYIPAGDTLRLKPSYKGNIQRYSWAPATYLSSTVMPEPVASGRKDITYSVTAFSADAPCKTTASIAVKILQPLKIPSAFTPNGDGLNDTWRIFNIEGYTECTVEVFNRWGNRVFYSKGYATPWNGTMNNQPVPAGTYLYTVRTSGRQGNIVQRGSVTILR